MKRTKNTILFLLFCSISGVLAAQSQSVYTFQKDDTLLRRKFYDQTIQKKNTLLASVGKENASDYKKIYTEQYDGISKLWKSSRTITSPEAHAYLQSILQKIINANKELQGTDARMVFTREWWPNAYSMGDGTITVNAGLMIFLNNEAQLVFAICHELSHYYLDHSGKAIKKMVETINSEELKKELKRLSKEQYRVNQQLEDLSRSLVFDSRRHSRENEAEADRQAFRFMKNTGYDCSAIKTCLELLNTIDDSVIYKPPVLPQLLNFTDYPFKNKWIQKESSIFSQMDKSESPLTKKEKDSLKTHPDCAKRMALLADSIQKVSGGKNFLVNESLFRQLKKELKMEMIEQCYKDEDITRHLYYCLGMLQAGENTPYAIYSIARDLNLIYKHQKEHSLGSIVDVEDRFQPEDYNLLLRMINRLRLDEIASLNYYFCEHYQEQMRDYGEFDKEMRKIPKPAN